MKLRLSPPKTAALTLVEALVVIIVIAVLLALLLPVKTRPRPSKMMMCMVNVKQVGVANLVWAGDHNGKFPMQVSVTNWGAKELALTGNVAGIFRTLSNELGTPKVLWCPADADRIVATNWENSLSAQNVSYFVGLDADTNQPKMFLSGDDNFQLGRFPVKSGSLKLSSGVPISWTPLSKGNPKYGIEVALLTNTSIAWADERHYNGGNIALADGSVIRLNTSNLQKTLVETGVATNRLAIP